MNGWTGLGIVAWVRWIIGVGGYGHNQLATKERDAPQAAYETAWISCFDAKSRHPAAAAEQAQDCGGEALESERKVTDG